MKSLELIGQVDDQHRLSLEVPLGIPPGPIKVILEVPDDDDDERSSAWATAVGLAWAADWSDPREDIYSLKDGKSEDEPR